MNYRSTIRVMMTSSDARYRGGLVDGARILQLFGDVATDLMIHMDGEGGLCAGYDEVKFLVAVYGGDFIEATGEIVEIGHRSRRMSFEARKLISAVSDTTFQLLNEPILVCTASGTSVRHKDGDGEARTR